MAGQRTAEFTRLNPKPSNTHALNAKLKPLTLDCLSSRPWGSPRECPASLRTRPGASSLRRRHSMLLLGGANPSPNSTIYAFHNFNVDGK